MLPREVAVARARSLGVEWLRKIEEGQAKWGQGMESIRLRGYSPWLSFQSPPSQSCIPVSSITWLDELCHAPFSLPFPSPLYFLHPILLSVCLLLSYLSFHCCPYYHVTLISLPSLSYTHAHTPEDTLRWTGSCEQPTTVPDTCCEGCKEGGANHSWKPGCPAWQQQGRAAAAAAAGLPCVLLRCCACPGCIDPRGLQG